MTYYKAAKESKRVINILRGSLAHIQGSDREEVEKDIQEFYKKKRKGYLCCTCKWGSVIFLIFSAVSTVVGVVLHYANWFRVI